MIKTMFKMAVILAAVATAAISFAAAPYVGASVGVKALTSSSGADFRGMPFSFFGGYGGIINQNLYLAGELFGTAGTVNLDNNGLQTTYAYGLSILPGLMLSEHTLGFARAGFVRTRFTPTGVTSSTRNGGQLGLGLQTGVSQNLDLRAEYTFTAYNSFSNISDPRSDEFNLGLIYKFY